MNWMHSSNGTGSQRASRLDNTAWPLIDDCSDPAPPYHPLHPTTHQQQATLTTYPSRLQLGTSSLAQPIYTTSYIQHRLQRPNSPIDQHPTSNTTTTTLPPSEPGRRARRVVNYSENDSSRLPPLDPDPDPSLEDDRPLRPPVIRGRPNHHSRPSTSSNLQHHSTPTATQSTHLLSRLSHAHSTPTPLGSSEQEARRHQEDDLNKRKFGDGRAYLGLDPPAKFLRVEKAATRSPLLINSLSLSEKNDHPNDPVCLVPVRIELDTDELRIRDVLTWNFKERYITPEMFSTAFCADAGISSNTYGPKIVEQIKAQLKQYAVVSATKLIPDEAELSRFSEEQLVGIEPDLRVIVQLDVQIETLHLMDRIEWDLASILTPELFTAQYICDLNLPRSASPIIAHAIHEELCRHKQDCLALGLISQEMLSATKFQPPKEPDTHTHPAGTTTSSLVGVMHTSFRFDMDPLLKEKYGSSRGAKKLEGVWRDWHEANLFGPKLQFVHVEDLEWMEIEKDRLARFVSCFVFLLKGEFCFVEEEEEGKGRLGGSRLVEHFI